MKIGSDFDGADNFFEGKIDNVMIFDRVLSGDEVEQLADAGVDSVLSAAAIEYDAAGNLTLNADGYQFFYDYENRLIEIADSSDTSIVEYAYDALGRRIQKDDKIAGQKTRYYNNHDWQVLAEYDDNGYHLRSYIYGSYIDEVLVLVDPNAGEDYYYAHNHLYSPTALLDDTGDIIERYEYDAYGRPYFMEPNFVLYETQKSNYNNTVLFTGRTVDILDNGKLTLQYSRNRYYDYHTGKWLTHDPWSITPNVLNPHGFSPLRQYRHGMSLNEYVGTHPLKYKDPFGWYYDPSENNNGEWQNGDPQDPDDVNIPPNRSDFPDLDWAGEDFVGEIEWKTEFRNGRMFECIHIIEFEGHAQWNHDGTEPRYEGDSPTGMEDEIGSDRRLMWDNMPSCEWFCCEVYIQLHSCYIGLNKNYMRTIVPRGENCAGKKFYVHACSGPWIIEGYWFWRKSYCKGNLFSVTVIRESDGGSDCSSY